MTTNVEEIAKEAFLNNRAVSNQINSRKQFADQTRRKSEVVDDNHNYPIQILRKRKEEVTTAKIELNEAIRKYTQLKKEVYRNQKMAQLAKLSCVKLFDIKKTKALNKSLVQEKKQRQMEIDRKKLHSVRKAKLQQQYYRELLRNQELFRRFKVREEFKKYKVSVRQAIEFKNRLIEEEGRGKFIAIKNEEIRLYQKKRAIENAKIEKGRENYLKKLQIQIKKIEAYNDLMAGVQENEKFALEELEEKKEIEAKVYQQIEGLTMLKSDRKDSSFFLTQKRDIRTSMTSRRPSKKICLGN